MTAILVSGLASGCAGHKSPSVVQPPAKVSPKLTKNLMSRYQRAAQLQLQNQHEKANQELSSLIQAQQKDGQAHFALPYYGLGVSLLNLEKAQAATDAFSTALSLKPGF